MSMFYSFYSISFTIFTIDSVDLSLCAVRDLHVRLQGDPNSSTQIRPETCAPPIMNRNTSQAKKGRGRSNATN